MLQLDLSSDRSHGRLEWLITVVFLIGLVWLPSACSLDKLIGDAPLPTDVIDPAATRTPAGALATYNSALARFRTAFDGYVAVSGVLADELHDGVSLGAPPGQFLDPSALDQRLLPELEQRDDDLVSPYTYGRVYVDLHGVRQQVQQAVGLLAAYAPASSPALRGHLYALEGYAEVMLAELFCSGIPLSTVDFDGDYTLTRGFSTDEVYRHAVALFDTAVALSGDSARILDLARIGEARALLGLGEIATAAEMVVQVPNDYRYQVQFTTLSGANALNFAHTKGAWAFSEADEEGKNGLDYRTSDDPRAMATRLASVNLWGAALYHPTKYAQTGASPIVLADGVEARLIAAEAELSAGDASWLKTLNALRTDGRFTTHPDTADPAQTDTVWHAGTGGVPDLRPLDDPGTPAARVSLLFRERAFWLFLTGHRQGDLRRLIRQYGRPQEQVYPIGPYPGGNGSYGADVTIPIPGSERAYNPHVVGCLSRVA